MGLYHSVYRAYGFEIPATTDFEHLDAVLADQPDSERLGRVEHTFLGDFEQLFLVAESSEIEANGFARITAADFTRYEIPVWTTVLHNIAVRLGHELDPEPAWLVLHDHS
ncbi:hypothetical protein GCM10010317_077810 [Streptomyces mirabilis]|uniref:hypothetical protein n=1 Tax=Streptomyces mirabilis TaxID=68239 RepID=UPI00167EDE1E|nr:hypothetical protein [Streptomyces mirabilis]GHD70463.1 hypothetical protein GCM10010317_077810 [Streptomyces mirabilis]